VICARCDERISADEKYSTDSIDGASGPGITIYRHAVPCQPIQPRQTAPVPATSWRRRW
jgi:hypothetical protein